MNKRELIKKIKEIQDITGDEKAYLIDLINTKKKYGLVWEDKPEDVEEQLRSMLPIFKEVKDRAIISEDKNAPNHILIEGDNLNALTALSYTHEGKIDVIYIDPPYNTGNKDFIYNDHYVDKEDTYRHSKWLSFMDKRLQIAKRLLSEQGVIFISIDDNEISQLNLLCNEIFGPYNFLSEFVVQSNPRGSQASKYFAVEHEYLLCFSKVRDPNLDFGLVKGEDSFKEYPLLDSNNKRYRLLGLRQRGGEWRRQQRPNMYYPIYINPNNGKVNDLQTDEFNIQTYPKRPNGEEGRWSWGPEKFVNDKNTLIGKKVKRKGQDDFWDIFRIDYLEKSDGDNKKTKTKTIWNETEINYQNGGNEIKDILGPDKFSFPKPLFLLKKIIGICSYSRELLILDFFAGSGTTLHATMALNAEDGGNRQCILVTNNENKIAEEVTYERNKRVIEGYTNAKNEGVEGLQNNNLRYFKSDFIPSERTEINRRLLTARCTELLSIKEDCFLCITLDYNINPKQAQIFTNGLGKYMVVVYYSRNQEAIIEKLIEVINELETTEKIKVYSFSPEKDHIEDDFFAVADKIDAVALPDSIYNAYRATFRMLKLNKKPASANSPTQEN